VLALSVGASTSRCEERLSEARFHDQPYIASGAQDGDFCLLVTFRVIESGLQKRTRELSVVADLIFAERHWIGLDPEALVFSAYFMLNLWTKDCNPEK
jgi:hypothetical protein